MKVFYRDNSCGCGIKEIFRIIGRMKTLKLEDVVMLMNKLKRYTFETNQFLFNKVKNHSKFSMKMSLVFR